MSWSRFITVENLCIAAEVTAAMLLLAFSIPEQRSKVKASEKDDGKSPLLELARRAFLEEQLARSLERLAMLDSTRPKVDYTERLTSELSDAEAIGWIDRLSGTFNRAFIDLFLNRWLALPNENRIGSYLSMISLKDYTELVRDSGPVQVELMLRDLGNRLKSQIAAHAIVARLPPDRFLMITFDGDPSVGVKCVDSASEDSRDSDAAPEEKAKPMSLVCSVVELSDEVSSFEDVVGQLEIGNDAATQLGEKFYFKQGSSWTSDIPTPNTSKRKSAPRSDDSSLRTRTGQFIAPTAIAEDEADGDAMSHSTETTDAADQTFQANGTTGIQETDAPVPDVLEAPIQGKSSDVLAVASNEEIAALFAQIKKHESESGKSQNVTTAKTSEGPSIANPVANSEVIQSDQAIETATTIEQPSVRNPQSSVEPTPAKKAESALKPQNAAIPHSSVEALSDTESLSESDSVSADDIASLFAAFKPHEVLDTLPAVKASPSDQSSTADVSSLSKKKAIESEKEGPRSVDVAELESMSENASADDIAALFKAVQQERQDDKALPATPSAVSNRQMAQEIEDLSETATADDIAELFKAVQQERKDDKAPPATPSAVSNRQMAQEIEDLSETATADDIAELFKAVQQERKDDKAPPANPSAVSNRQMAQEIEDLSETATADDIAELFKAVQQERKDDKAPPATPSAVSNRQMAQEIEDLSETATADDIAELFKAVQQESKEVKPSPSASNTSAKRQFAQEIEELSETATVDDIAELFKAVKSGVGPTKEPAQAAPPPIEEDLGETATADDIAALFAKVKKESADKGRK